MYIHTYYNVCLKNLDRDSHKLNKLNAALEIYRVFKIIYDLINIIGGICVTFSSC